MDQHLRRAVASVSASQAIVSTRALLGGGLKHQIDSITGALMTYKRRRGSGPQQADAHLDLAIQQLTELRKTLTTTTPEKTK